MSQDSGSEQRQRTVAELLAQYGEASGEAGSAEPKRRRRRADDDAEETAPQAIIDRVMSDSGRMRPVPDEQYDGAAGPDGAGQQPPQAPQDGTNHSHARPGRPTRRARRAPTRFGAPVEPPSDAQQTQQQPAVPPAGPPPAAPPPAAPPPGGQPPAGPGGPAQAGPGQPRAGRATATQPGMQPAGAQQQPPVAPANRTQQQPPVPPPAGAPGPANSGPPPSPPASTDNGNRGGLRARLGGGTAEPHTEQFPAVTDDTEAPGPAPAGLRQDSALGRSTTTDDPENLDETQFGMPPLQREDEDADEDYEYGSDYDRDYDDGYDYFDDSDGATDDEDAGERGEERGSTGRDWLVLVGLIAASVIGGAAVWLGFDWLWGQIPAAALVGALVVIAGMVWIVRRVRNDDDLQTTVFSVLVGLIITVSPAALLLLKH